MLAQLGKPDMRGPISYAMAHPARLDYGSEKLDFARLGTLSFASPDTRRFPCLDYARAALKSGGTAPVVLNGANEAAVQAFLQGKIRFGAIARVVKNALDKCEIRNENNETDVYEADRASRDAAAIEIARLVPEG